MRRYKMSGWHLLFLGDAFAAHALAGVVELGHDILGDDIAGTDDASANGEGSAIPAEPASYGRDHGFWREASV